MKKIIDILSGIFIIKSIGDLQTKISNVQSDSRKINGESLFVAVKGTQVDGHNYIQTAIDKGATAIICEKIPFKTANSIIFIELENTGKALGQIASNFYGNPSSEMKLVGVTGTNGKTTIASLLYDLFRNLGYKAGLLSTVQNIIDKKIVEATHTTPDPIQINYLLKQMLEAGCEYCFMEISSHSIHQSRIKGLEFKGGIFTNITHDHLDYHKTFDKYLKVKKSFFDNLPKHAFALSNKDDKNGMLMLQNTNAHKNTYAIKSLSDFKVKILESHFDGMLISIDGTEVWTQFVGQFNAYNILAAYSSAILLNQDKDEIITTISKLRPVSGRFECLKSEKGIFAIIDYAHTPDALLNVLRTINQLRKSDENIITVVGSGGDRDKLKRSEMAKVSVENSNKVILTSDNPRFEEPQDIINDMKKGVEEKYNYKVLCIIDRKEAIRTACMLARKGDILLIAGKGHETYQDIKGEKHHLNDKEIINENLFI